MPRLLLAACVAGCVLNGGGARMEAQELEPGRYDAGALRVEARSGNWLLVRGREGAIVGKIGAFRGLDLASAVSSSPDAVREAKEFQHNYGRGSTVMAIGIALWGIGAGGTRVDDVDPAITAAAWGTVAVGTLMMYRGGKQINKGLTAMARSIWWYNRDLAR